MTNFEFYVDALIEKLEQNEPMHCAGINALTVLLGKEVRCVGAEKTCTDCWANILKILKQEHVERPKVTKHERAFLELVGIGWIARDLKGELYYYRQEPQKGNASWCGVEIRACARIDTALGMDFEFIKWDEDEPRKVEDLLQLEVADT
jgi:hypothetical protein